MFNATKIHQGISEVQNLAQLLELLSASVGYTYGDRFSLGNYKIGTSSVQPDEAHPDWQWTPIAGTLYSIAMCQIPAEGVVAFVTGTRDRDIAKNVLCVYCSDATTRSELYAKLSTADGDSTIGAKLANMLGYSDWSTVAGPSPEASNKCTCVFANATGVQTATAGYISPVALALPDDGSHSSVSVYDPYSGLMLLDPETALPTMLMSFWSQTLSSVTLIMGKSSYDADYQNTVDIIHGAMANNIATTANRVVANEQHIAGLIAANGTLYSVISMIPVFGSKFADVVDAQQRIEQAGQYIPRP